MFCEGLGTYDEDGYPLWKYRCHESDGWITYNDWDCVRSRRDQSRPQTKDCVDDCEGLFDKFGIITHPSN